jgi:competence protein ComFB
MELVNFMEEAVLRLMDELFAQAPYREMVFNDKDRMDVAAYTLNRLPPRYVVTEKGHLFTRAAELRQQFRTDIIVELTKAIQHIKSNPR